MWSPFLYLVLQVTEKLHTSSHDDLLNVYLTKLIGKKQKKCRFPKIILGKAMKVPYSSNTPASTWKKVVLAVAIICLQWKCVCVTLMSFSICPVFTITTPKTSHILDSQHIFHMNPVSFDGAKCMPYICNFHWLFQAMLE